MWAPRGRPLLLDGTLLISGSMVLLVAVVLTPAIAAMAAIAANKPRDLSMVFLGWL
jgi:hypothetical protein